MTEGALDALMLVFELYDAQGMASLCDAMPCDCFGRPFAPLFWRSLVVVASPQSHSSVPSKVFYDVMIFWGNGWM